MGLMGPGWGAGRSKSAGAGRSPTRSARRIDDPASRSPVNSLRREPAIDASRRYRPSRVAGPVPSLLELLASIAPDLEQRVRAQLTGFAAMFVRPYLPQRWVFVTETETASLVVDATGGVTAVAGIAAPGRHAGDRPRTPSDCADHPPKGPRPARSAEGDAPHIEGGDGVSVPPIPTRALIR